jgi:hypothetical protein
MDFLVPSFSNYVFADRCGNNQALAPNAARSLCLAATELRCLQQRPYFCRQYRDNRLVLAAVARTISYLANSLTKQLPDNLTSSMASAGEPDRPSADQQPVAMKIMKIMKMIT